MVKFKKWLYTMREYDPPLEGRFGNVRLDFNENTKGASRKVAEAVAKINAERLSCYPEYGDICTKIAKYAKVEAKEVLLTNGSDEAIKLVFDCFVNSGDEVIIPYPTYAMFTIYAEAAGAMIKKVLYNPDLSYPTKKVLKSIGPKTSLVIVCSPNNPTGTSIENKDLEKILKKAKNAVVLVDEAYFEFCGKSAVALVGKYDNLVVTRTFSKAFGVAALRAGYLISCSENQKIFRKVYSPYAVNYFAKVAIDAVLGDLKYLKSYVKEVLQNKKTFRKEISKLGVEYFYGNANFILVRLGSSSCFFTNKLREQGILVRDRSTYPLLEGCVRITIGDRKSARAALEAIKEILKRQVLIFDIDGVLIDVSKSYRTAIKKTVGYFTKRNLSLAEIQKWKDSTGINNDWELSKAIMESRGVGVMMRDVVNKFQKFYLGKNFNGLILKEKLLINKMLLEELAGEYRLAILTGRPREEAEFALKRFEIKDLFLEIVAMEDIPKNKGKPDPFGLELLKERMFARSGYYFGDTISDMKAAKAAGLSAIGVIPNKKFEKQTRRALKETGAEVVLNSINELRRVLE